MKLSGRPWWVLRLRNWKGSITYFIVPFAVNLFSGSNCAFGRLLVLKPLLRGCARHGEFKIQSARTPMRPTLDC